MGEPQTVADEGHQVHDLKGSEGHVSGTKPDSYSDNRQREPAVNLLAESWQILDLVVHAIAEPSFIL
jgi:hypothetical protein